MSDSGIPQPPPGGPKTVLSLFLRGKEDGQPVRIEKASGTLEVIRKPVRVEGEVVRADRDGAVRIRTPQGDIDVRIRVRDGQPLPREGARVEVDIAPGQPPRQGLIRPAPPETTSAPPRDSIPGDAVARPSLAHEDIAPAATPPGGAPRAPANRPPPQAAPLPPDALPLPDPAAFPVTLDAGDYVRLLPLPPQLADSIVFPEPENAVVTQIARVALVPVLAAEKIVDEQGRELLRLFPPPEKISPPPPAVAPDHTGAGVPSLSASPSLPQPQVQIQAQIQTMDRLISAAAPEAVSSAPVFPLAPLPQQPFLSVSFPVVAAFPPPVLVLTGIRETAQVFIRPESRLPLQPPSQTPAPVPPQSFPPPVSIVHDIVTPWADPAVPALEQAQLHLPSVTLSAPAAPPPAPLLHHRPVRLPPGDLAAAVKQPASFLQFLLKPRAGVMAASPSAPPAPYPLDVLVTARPLPAVRIMPPEAGQPEMMRAVKTSPLPPPPVATGHLNPFFASALPVPQDAPVTKMDAENLKIIARLPPQPAVTVVQKLPAAALAAVVGRTPQDFPVVAVRLPGVPQPQNFILQANAVNLAPGTLIEFIPQPGMAGAFYHAPFPSARAGMETGAPAPLSAVWQQIFGDFAWPAMAELQQVLQQDGGRAAAALARTAPNPANPARMAAGALFFLAAVRAGDVAGWLGDKTLDLLRRAGRADTVARLGRDFAGMQRTATEPSGSGQDWRAVALPMMNQHEIQKMMLYYRGGRRDGDKDDPDGGTRFIFDLQLPRMGKIQLDGLHRPVRKQLDLVVRTASPVGGGMQQAMQVTWASAIGQAGMSGSLFFQNKESRFVKIPVAAAHSGLTV